MHFAAPFLAVLAAVGSTVEAQRAVCSRRQYADVANRIQNPAYFCKFWLADKRTGLGPLYPAYGVRSLTKLCRCFVQNSPRVTGPFKPLRPSAPPSGCPTSLYRPLRNQYRDPKQFCRFYNANGSRTLSPLPAVPNPQAVYQACRCLLNNRFAAQQTTTTESDPEPTDEPEPTDDPTDTTTDVPEPTSTNGATTTSDAPVTTSTASDITLLPTDLFTSEATSTVADVTTSGTSSAPTADTTSFTSSAASAASAASDSSSSSSSAASG